VHWSFQPKVLFGWYRKSDCFNYHVRVGEKLNFDTYAFDFFDGASLPTNPDSVPARA